MIIIFEKDLKIPLLLDTYGDLLTERKRELADLYYSEDYSLAEISEVTGISRQGIRDSIKKTVSELYELEEKLGVAEKLQYFDRCFNKLSSDLTSIMEACGSDDIIKKRLSEVIKNISDFQSNKPT